MSFLYFLQNSVFSTLSQWCHRQYRIMDFLIGYQKFGTCLSSYLSFICLPFVQVKWNVSWSDVHYHLHQVQMVLLTFKLPSCFNFLATLYSKILLQSHSALLSCCHGKTILLYKKGDASLPKNFRPITLTSVLGKLFTIFYHYIWKSLSCPTNYLTHPFKKNFFMVSMVQWNTFSTLTLC